jgi:hypothetical protein
MKGRGEILVLVIARAGVFESLIDKKTRHAREVEN